MERPFGDIYRSKRVLVTGHTGFKGAWMALWLTELGAEVAGYALEPPTEPNLFGRLGLQGQVRSMVGDTRNLDSLMGFLSEVRPEMVFHMAAQSLVRRSYKEPVETYGTNVMGTVNLLEACRQTPSVRAIVNVTSDKCYENRERVRGYSEEDRLGGYDPYSSSKACAELVTRAYQRSYFNPTGYERHGMALASARAGNVIGGGDWAEDRLIPDCIRALMEDREIIIRYPDAVRPWQHVLDPLSGYLLLGRGLYEQGPVFSGHWNFGPDNSSLKPVRSIVERVLGLWPGPGSWRADVADNPHETGCLTLNSSKARTKLGWAPRWGVETALEKTVEGYMAFVDGGEMSEVCMEQTRCYEKSPTGIDGNVV